MCLSCCLTTGDIFSVEALPI